MKFIERLHSRDPHLCDKRNRLQEKGSTPKALVWDTNMAAVRSSENAPLTLYSNRAFSHDVTAAILVFQNNKTAAMLVFQTSRVVIELIM